MPSQVFAPAKHHMPFHKTASRKTSLSLFSARHPFIRQFPEKTSHDTTESPKKPEISTSYHGQGNSYKGKRFIVTGLQFQRFSPLSSWWEAWQNPGRHGAGEQAESSTS